jgi:hypothetical protein
MRRNKLNAHKTVVDGVEFDSKKEAARWVELRQLEADGKIRGLERQVPFEILPKQKRADGKTERAVTYRADFMYTDENNQLVVEDVKGYRGGAAYAVFVLKRKLMLYRFGLSVKEI